MNDLMLFLDASVDPHSKTGYGAYLLLSELPLSNNDVESRILLKRFEQTSSTRLELQTFLWALDEIGAVQNKISVFTDCQNLVDLPARQERLEANNFTARNGQPLGMAELYQPFFRFSDELNFEFVKLRGHSAGNQKNSVEKVFSLVDRACRRALRNTL